MKKYISVFLGIAVAASVAHSATVESQNVVGFFKVNMQSNAYNAISIPMQKLTVFTGVIEANSTNTIVDNEASWTVGEWAAGVDSSVVGSTHIESGLSTYYLEISAPTDSAYYGRHYYITGNSGTALTVTGSDFGASDAGIVGASYKIVPAQRVRDIFGEPGGDVSLVSGANFFDAAKDEVLFWNGSGWDIAWYQTGVGYKVGFSADGNDMVIDRDEGCFVNKRSVSTNLVVTGEVSGSSQGIPLVGSGGYNLVGGQAVVDQAIGDTGLDSIVSKGANFFDGTKSEVLCWNGAGWDILWCRASDTNWVQGFSTVVTTTYIIEAGTGYFIKHAGANDTWTRSSPLE